MSKSKQDLIFKTATGLQAQLKTVPIFLPWVVLVLSESLALCIVAYALVIWDFEKISFIYKRKLKAIPGFKKCFRVSVALSVLYSFFGYFVIGALHSKTIEESMFIAFALLGGLIMFISGFYIYHLFISNYELVVDQ